MPKLPLSDEAAKSLREGTGVVVVHGIDFNGNGKYDDNLGPSDLDPKLPSEATNPALRGPLKMAAKGAVHGGQGGTQETINTAAAAGGATLLVGAVAAYGLRQPELTRLVWRFTASGAVAVPTPRRPPHAPPRG